MVDDSFSKVGRIPWASWVVGTESKCHCELENGRRSERNRGFGGGRSKGRESYKTAALQAMIVVSHIVLQVVGGGGGGGVYQWLRPVRSSSFTILTVDSFSPRRFS